MLGSGRRKNQFNAQDSLRTIRCVGSVYPKGIRGLKWGDISQYSLIFDPNVQCGIKREHLGCERTRWNGLRVGCRQIQISYANLIHCGCKRTRDWEFISGTRILKSHTELVVVQFGTPYGRRVNQFISHSLHSVVQGEITGQNIKIVPPRHVDKREGWVCELAPNSCPILILQLLGHARARCIWKAAKSFTCCTAADRVNKISLCCIESQS